MTAALDPLSPEALLGPASEANGGDWVDDVQANSESYGRYELVFDEATGQYELKDLGAPPPPAQTHAAEPQDAITPDGITLDASDEDVPLVLASWASLAGPTGPSAFHTPYYWSKNLRSPADLGAIAALAESGCGAAWRLRPAA